ncbi:MAG: YebC/PmpR family DNA-binding transcriptional regulator [Planctomycetota bacterium]|jgi:YebC/PmpR family DNA-binding regulatory protein
MAGHSHSKNVQFRKDRVNALKAKTFSKVGRMITVAAKQGGPDPDGNPHLRLALEKARLASMPKDTIERAIKKGAGGADLGDYEDLLYEGYGTGGVAVMVEILTDNRNRTAPEVRKIFEKCGGNLGTSGAVAWMFERVAVIRVTPDSSFSEDDLLEKALEAGAEDLVEEDGAVEVRAAASDMHSVMAELEKAGVPLAGGEVCYLPKTKAEINSVEEAKKIVRLLEALEDHDDVQSVFANHSFSEEVRGGLESES